MIHAACLAIALVVVCHASGSGEGQEAARAVNVADVRRGSLMLCRAGGEVLGNQLAIDGNLVSGWVTEGDGEANEAVLVLDHLYATVGLRIHSGYAGHMAITQLRLWYATSLLNPDHFHNRSAYNLALFSEVSWKHFSSLSHDDYMEVQEGVILTHAMTSALHHPPLLVRAVKIAIDDWTPGGGPAILNEVEVLAPLHLNPSLHDDDDVDRPAFGYVWPLYNRSLSTKEEAQEEEPRFLWFGELEHNESIVRSDIRVNLSAVNCEVPAEALVEVYFGGKKVSSSTTSSHVSFTVSGLDPGLHIVTARLRSVLTGELLPLMDRRAFFVRRQPAVHPFFLTRNIEVIGDGVVKSVAGERSKFRIHVIEEEASAAGMDDQGSTCTSRWGSRMPWEANTQEHWTVLLRGPALIVGNVVPTDTIGVYDASYTAVDPGWYDLHIVLHYAQCSGLRNPGDGGEEEVIEVQVPGSPFRVFVSDQGYSNCFPNGSQLAVNPFRPEALKPRCSKLEPAEAEGRWVNKHLLCSATSRETLPCSHADEMDDWVWVPWRCSLPKRVPLEAQQCLEERNRRILFAGASPQRTLFFDVADLILPGDMVKTKAHQDLEFPPSAYFHWIPYDTQDKPGCPLNCLIDYDQVTWHIDKFVNLTSKNDKDLIVVQASIHDIFFGTLDNYFRNIPKLARLLRALLKRQRILPLFRHGDAIHLPRGGDVSLVKHGFRSQRMIAALEFARRIMKEAGVPILDTLSFTVVRPEGTSDGYHFNEWACLEDNFRGNSISRTIANIVLHYACEDS
ncbi:hypothetical protein GUITHDRAFT_148897 [Guillardia theta CCMP2712]|uniref:Sialate O-acetylesterase domain-containing protein n=2 Tax=Guillardia theta TaxID=55529 RepID=L1I7G3_GUITC|nr:hypothetical protein GUITHDRAFT_148897 [Guillardia theta CCMP2712]EKX32027.1 hypothetical protein GUITHDRAFT_148897 [Guillardia theta CCMP2712]|eukprot:XP_005819007.1 hypothetical protein GUITHDRAFT_148897 [Guillardia theta CCMP2712]